MTIKAIVAITDGTTKALLFNSIEDCADWLKRRATYILNVVDIHTILPGERRQGRDEA